MTKQAQPCAGSLHSEGIVMPKSKLLKLVAATAALALVAGCAKAPVNESAKVSDEVKASMTEMVAAFAARDADKAVSWDAPDFVGMFHGTPNVSGQEGDRALTKQQVDDPEMKFSVSDVVVHRAIWQSGGRPIATPIPILSPRSPRPKWAIGSSVGSASPMAR
jgi:hypothetical protein